MKVFRFLGSLGAAFAILVMFIASVLTKGINPQMIDSGTDKLFWFLLFVGFGMCYVTVAICLFKNYKPTEHKSVLLAMLISSFVFMVGLYYHIIFQSPW